VTRQVFANAAIAASRVAAHPGGPDRRSIGLEDSANHNAVRQYIKIVLIPLA
jgi:hypothetical protein